MAKTITLHYYKFTDPKTGGLTKQLGWVIIQDQVQYHTQQDPISGLWNTISSVPVQSYYEVIPREEDTIEITLDEYTAMDTTTTESNENYTKRMVQEFQVARLQTLFALVQGT